MPKTRKRLRRQITTLLQPNTVARLDMMVEEGPWESRQALMKFLLEQAVEDSTLLPKIPARAELSPELREALLNEITAYINRTDLAARNGVTFVKAEAERSITRALSEARIKEKSAAKN